MLVEMFVEVSFGAHRREDIGGELMAGPLLAHPSELFIDMALVGVIVGGFHLVLFANFKCNLLLVKTVITVNQCTFKQSVHSEKKSSSDFHHSLFSFLCSYNIIICSV